MKTASRWPLRLKRTLLLLLGLTTVATASWAADPLCSDALWEQMVGRGRLKGQIEQTRAENAIYKPDSIMEYNCLEAFVDFTPPHIRPILPDGTVALTNAPVNAIVKDTLQKFLFGNYGHRFLGGRDRVERTPLGTLGASYNCDTMNFVWELAKCLPDIVPQDNMMTTFDFVTARDPRVLPKKCKAAPTTGYGSTPVIATANSIKIGGVPIPPATNNNGQATNASGGGGGAGNNNTAVNCGNPVPTGNTINLESIDVDRHGAYFPDLGTRTVNNEPVRNAVYREKTCPNPACTYVPTGENTGECRAAY